MPDLALCGWSPRRWGLAKMRKARIAAGLGGKSVAVLRARFTTLVREAAKVIKAGKEGADRVTHGA